MVRPFLKHSFLHYEPDINQTVAQTNEKTILARCHFFFLCALSFNPQGTFLTMFNLVLQLYLTDMYNVYRHALRVKDLLDDNQTLYLIHPLKGSRRFGYSTS